MAVESC